MNYLLCSLRWIVVLSLAVASVMAKASLYQQNPAEEFEKAWSCEPVFHEEVMVNRSLGKLNTFDAMASLPEEMLEFHGCDKESWEYRHARDWRRDFINRYVTFYWETPPLIFGYIAIQGNGTFGQLQESLSNHDNGIISKILISPEFYKKQDEIIKRRQQQELELRREQEALQNAKQEEERKRAETLAAQAADKAATEEALKIRTSQLKNGSIPISNFDDALVVHDPKSLVDVMTAPLLKPDQAVYSIGRVKLDGEEGEHLLRVKFDGFCIGYDCIETGYAMLRLSGKSIDYSQGGMRIGGMIKAIGRYAQNMKYKTIRGDVKTMPVVDVMYIGVSD